ncbi:Capsular polysaccharide synthesis protein [Epilithonimonas bovis DSM 19482]|uniref:Capsular polysaccharide synthesis protein n=1 Tax=Epilithonimonas bovis DSM 19482 TaxID=1121284 RepID=A0A1U7PZM7_9FLAO|nr:capsular polysaccharide synthesis protein [Epilithonimonas bovis]SIT97533.1 Capsular polysaccharide synthesis protein [Epilithonimonas bovis DSM 19482]
MIIQKYRKKLLSLKNDYQNKRSFFTIIKSFQFTISPYFPHVLNRNHADILNLLKIKFRLLIQNYHNLHSSSGNKIENRLWVMWWQGYNSMPTLVKSCYNSIKKVYPNMDLVLITEENYKNYLQLPEHILQHVQNKNISLTHLSDILRMGLLSKHGGVWIDATIYLTGQIDFHSKSFFSIRQHKEYARYVLKGNKWTPYLLASSKNYKLATFAYDFLIEYWKIENKLIDYFLIDYIIAIAYETFPDVRADIDDLSFEYEGVYFMAEKLNDKFDKFELKKNIINKLSYKNTYTTKIDDTITNYGFLVKDFQ